MQPSEVSQRLLIYYSSENPDFEQLRITTVSRLTDGWETIVYEFTLSYRKTGELMDKDLILRIFPGSEGKQRAEDEFNVMASLMMTTVPVPDPYRLETDNAAFPIPFIIMEKIQGRVLSSHILSHPEKLEHLLSNFTRIFCDLHSLDWKTIITDTRRFSVSNPYQYIVQLMNQFKDTIETYDKKEFIPVLRWLVERMDTVPNEDLSLLHGDFHLANVLIDPHGDLFVIDWTKTTVGDYRVDLAWSLITHEAVLGKEIRDIIFNNYQAIRGRIENIEYFEVVAILRLLLDLSINFTYSNEAARLNPDKVGKLKENLDPIKTALSILQGHTRIKIPDFERMLT